MEKTTGFFRKMAMVVWVVLVLFLGVFLFPWKMITWGSVRLASERTITVTGLAETKAKNQIASFTVGVNVTKDKKEDAVSEVNGKMDEIVKALKGFGIKTEDIKTQNNNIYQMQESYYDNGVQKNRPGQWTVSNSVEITLREVDRAAALADLLAKTGANNVYGPNFMMDQTSSFDEALMAQAIDDARKKAEAMARSARSQLGEVLSVVEGSGQMPVYPLMRAQSGGGGGAVVEPGSSLVSKTVTVTFGLR